MEQYMHKSKIEYIKTEQILNDLWDAREKPNYESDSEFLFLKQSIKSSGLYNAIHVTPTKKGYSIIDGRRRFEAMKQLGFKEIECKLITGKSQQEIAAITVIANLHSKKLNDVERCNGITQVFQMCGYTKDEAITNCKRIHNKDFENIPDQFKEIVESIGYSANYIYQLIQLVRDLPPKVLEYAGKVGLSTHQKIALTHSKLREHPKIQKIAIDRIKREAGKDIKITRLIVAQYIRDLETEALLKDGNSYIQQPSLREKIKPSIESEIVKSPHQYYFDILESAQDLIKYLTGHQLTKGEYEYTENHIKYSSSHRLELIKSLDSRTGLALEKELFTLRKAIDSTLELISNEVKS
jgi:ParB/RepB/Spo0J family partition protein